MTNFESNQLTAKLMGYVPFELQGNTKKYYFVEKSQSEMNVICPSKVLLFEDNQFKCEWDPCKNIEQARKLVISVCDTAKMKSHFLSYLIGEGFEDDEAYFDLVIKGNPIWWVEAILAITDNNQTEVPF